ncbi:acetyl/propionyl/methylcrotonyl-CoA carboxylase subunit alpha [Rubrivivax sp. RP6-9]|uniref:acetyl/propionyl/methylcrotonyl-CoA carboxylase subunit alpha n=1 Tax=Rubrivivax sp. RP6-9 TaxID=3415750 RepID=UPI003CC5E05A
MSFRKILIANRGEIACRVARTAHRLGYRTVAVYSDADAGAPHVLQADEAVHIGAAPAAASYLNVDALLAAARATGADAVHPGYGFLSERAEFAQACADAGLVFIGPPPEAIRAMGDKAGAKRRMLAAGVPCAPGYLGEDQSDTRLAAEAERLGLPLLVKAVAGGGGRGMRLVRDLAELPAALAGARREAESAFGDGTLMLERLIDDGRHIEIQVFADAHGNAVHLGERDCTAQRRRQKVIEEAPSPIVDAAMRSTMGRDAVAAALAVGYRGAGTVEFIVDAQGRHFFLEMNTRLQVEHTVTECITGLDLVEWQLRVAEGQPLPLAQDAIRFTGHAIQARLYAEDPYDGWTPQTGRIAGWRPEASDLRIDHGIAEGGAVTPYYDAMVAKFIAHGHDRADAVHRLTRALDEVPLLGLRNNGRFLRDLLQHPQFTASTMTTTRLDAWAAAGEPLLQRPAPPEAAWQLAAALLAPATAARPASVASQDLTLVCDGTTRTLRAPPDGVQLLSEHGGALRCVIDGVVRRARVARDGALLHLALDGGSFTFGEASPYPVRDTGADPRRARAPVAGVVAQVLVAPGDVVAAGQPLLCVEAMKMEMWLHAGAAGTVRAVHTAVKAPVAAGAVLVELELSE